MTCKKCICRECEQLKVNHWPFVVYAKGAPDFIKWHVLGPGVDTAKHFEGWSDSKDAESHALNCKRHH